MFRQCAKFVILSILVGNGMACDVMCDKDMLSAFIHQNKVASFCLETVQKLADERAPIAFYAYMTASLTTAGPGSVLVFETVRTNVHNAYNNATGVYTVPKSGMYVFTWTIREWKSEHSIELVRNSEVLGATFKRAEGNDDGSVTGNVVVGVNKGDSVFVRTHSTYDKKQQILNNLHGRSTFSGWRL